MAKTLKDILEVAKPVSPADKAFVAKHTIKVTPDANKNGDDVFKASKTKTYKRSPTHGYDNGADEKVYEEHMTAADKAKEKAIKSKTDKSDMKASMQKQYGPEKGKQVYFATIRKQAMESVDIDEAKAGTLSALTGKASPIDDYADMIAKFKAKGGGVTKVAPKELDDKEKAKLSATFGKGGGKGGSALATGEYASMNTKDASYNAKQALARKKAMGMKEETDLDEAALKYATVDPKQVKTVLAAHRATGESARHMGNGKIAYSGKKLVKEDLENITEDELMELDEAVAKDHYDMHHKRAMSALNDIGKHLIKQKAMCDKSDNKWAHQDNAWGMKELSRQLEDMSQNAAQRTENMTPLAQPKDSIRGY